VHTLNIRHIQHCTRFSDKISIL